MNVAENTQLNENNNAEKKSLMSRLLFLLPVIALVAGVTIGYLGLVKTGLFEQHKDESITHINEINQLQKNEIGDLDYIPIDPIIVTLVNSEGGMRQLRAILILEIKQKDKLEVEKFKARIVDSFNFYLRSLNEKDFSTPDRLFRVQNQLLKRAKLTAKEESTINNVLISEFVLN